LAKGNGLTAYIHTEDNVVQHYNTKRDAEGNTKSVTYIVKKKSSLTSYWTSRFISCKPQVFHIVDIIQVQLSFIVIPVNGGHQKILSVLCSLALLDGSFCKVYCMSLTFEPNSTLFTLMLRK